MLKELFDPETIAVIGASEKEGKVGNLVFRYLAESKAEVFPVNPGYGTIHGKKCYKSVNEIEKGIDLAVVCTPASVSVKMVKECVENKVKFVIPLAGGFGETGPRGKEMEKEMKESIREKKTRILGPNTLGIFVPGSVDTMFLERKRSPRPGAGSIAFVSQSGATAATIMNGANLYSIGFSAFVGLGNRIDLNENDFIEHFSRDEKTDVIALYLESFADGHEFRKVVEKSEKPIVMLKAGRSDSGRKAAASHTGSLSGSDRIINGLCEQYGITRAYDEEELIDYSRALAYCKPFSGDRIAVISTAGGHGVIATDCITSKEHGISLKMAKFGESTVEKMKKVALGFASLSNPIDLTASATDEMYKQVIETVMEDDNIDAILVSVLFDPPGITEKLVDVVVGVEKKKPLVVYSVGSEMTLKAIRRFEEAKIPAYPSIWRGIRALGVLHKRGRFLEVKNESLQ